MKRRCAALLCFAISAFTACLIPHGVYSFESQFPVDVQRYWIGPEYWSNPMEDWQIKDGRIECLSAFSNRNVQLLTHELNSSNRAFKLQVETGLLAPGAQQGSVGFRFAIQDQIKDYRARLFYGAGIDAGLTTDGTIYIQNEKRTLKTAPPLENLALILEGNPTESQYQITFAIHDINSGQEIASITKLFPDPSQLEGNIAIVNNYNLDNKTYGSNFRNKNDNGPRFWFKNWTVTGHKISIHPEREFGPILWTMYSLSRRTMKLTALFPPIGANDNQNAILQIQDDDAWKTIGDELIDPDARTATFTVSNWQDFRDIPYRVKYTLKQAGGAIQDYFWNGAIRKDPIDQDDLILAAFCCQTDYGFPHNELVSNVKIQDPDLLFFAGDQIYESVGGYGIIRTPADRSILNYLRKYYMFGWAFRDLMRDRPTLCIPDDHDVFQGNLWGNGGNAISAADHDAGGYIQPAQMVKAVHRTHISHHPACFDPTPIQQDIQAYYGDMVYGRVSFAVLADRMFKSGPKKTVATWPGRPDHVKDESIDVDALDAPGLVLLGERQLKFLDHWGRDWDGADMKAVLSQTIFCNVATHHGPDLAMRLIADLDSNGWPQTGRNKALEAIRKSFAVHIAGDQHVPSLLQHGIDDFKDAIWSFCVPAISVGYQRAWRPDQLGFPVVGRPAHNLPNTGDYMDGLKNLISVYAIGNPGEELRRDSRIHTLHDKSSGYGIIRFHKDTREITFEAWKLQFNANRPQPSDQFDGWPKTISQYDNDGRKAKAWLPTFHFNNVIDPVLQVINEKNNEIVYTLRIKGTSFAPKVYEPGTYTIKIRTQANQQKTLTGVKTNQTQNETSRVIDM
ncbi:MAG: alkaline phosphatase D family protein [Candidatus Omnitrophica bacterium]|nr:alkaline phosphatase D family protein [Candidatus Omnitrophota bacterium]